MAVFEKLKNRPYRANINIIYVQGISKVVISG